MDIDNCCKSILDALQDAGLYNDDKQVYRLAIERKEIVSGGGVIVKVDRFKPLKPE
jgi:Holliday junction resolvase RusA-like endonuclease